MDPDITGGQLRNGQLLADRYLVEELIGRGGMAEVYRGKDERLTRPIALKVLRAHFATDPALRLRFEEEARAAAHVSHPNVVAVYDAGEDDSKAFIVMELVAGETLHDLIARGPVGASLARSIGAQVLDALAAAHERGVLHRDIKPANVLLTPEGQAKVADFGIAKAVQPSPEAHDQTTMNVVLGTPSYLAPERAQGAPATAASDLWSVGVLLYEAVTGVKPFQGDNAVAVTLAAEQGRYVPVLQARPDLDPALAAVIQRALLANPALRFSSAREMADALRGPASEETLLLGGTGALGALAATQILDSPASQPTSVLPHAALLGAAGLGAAGLASPATGTAPLAGAPPVAAAGTGRRRGAAVLAGAGIALLAGGLIALLLLLPGSSGDHAGTTGAGGGTSGHDHHHHKGAAGATGSSSTTSVAASSSSTSSTSTTSSTRPPASSTTTTTTGPSTSTSTTTTTSPATTTTTTTTSTTTTTLPAGAAVPPGTQPKGGPPTPPGGGG